MCGIAGLLTPAAGDAAGTSAILQYMTRRHAHPRPASYGYWI